MQILWRSQKILEKLYVGNYSDNRPSILPCYIYTSYTSYLYKLCLGWNISLYLMIFLWKLIKNSYSAIKNLKKLWLQTKFSNFWMQLVLIKNILWFSHNKLDKHLISSKKDPSWVPMFVSHNGTHKIKIKIDWTKSSSFWMEYFLSL